MSAVKPDYYELLGVPRDADSATIRAAFGAAVRQCDPALSDAPDAEDRFRELKEAYAVLSRPGSRLLYDRFGYRGRTSDGLDQAHWQAREPAAQGEDIAEELVLRRFETGRGGSRLFAFEAAETCPLCEGTGSADEPDPNCPACGGTGRYVRRANDDVKTLETERCPVCAPEPCEQCGGSGRIEVLRRLRVKFPPGIERGDQLRVAGEGNAGPRDGAPGDLLLEVTVIPEPRESRLVRYAALLLFLSAVVILFVYLH
jgi:molecular chaperone DnaJ